MEELAAELLTKERVKTAASKRHQVMLRTFNDVKEILFLALPVNILNVLFKGSEPLNEVV